MKIVTGLKRVLFALVWLTVGGAAGSSVTFNKTLSLEGISFHVTGWVKSDYGLLKIVPHGLKRNKPMFQKIDYAIVTNGDIGDLNHDGRPELYLFTHQMGSGEYGSVIAYGVGSEGTLKPIAYKAPNENSRLWDHYRGKDEFFILGDYLIRRFPLYREDDPDCCPSGGHRLLYYRLVPSANGGLKLKLVKVENRS